MSTWSWWAARSRHRLHGLLQYTDWELVRLCPKPLLLIKDPSAWRVGSVLAAIDPGHAFDKPADLDRRILQQAARLAAALGKAVHVVHAVTLPPADPHSGNSSLPCRRGRDARDRAVSGAERGGRHSQGRRTDCRPSPDDRDAVGSDSRIADACGAEVVVMGAMSRSTLKRWLLGDTALKVLDQLHADVLIVKPTASEAANGVLEATAA